MNASSVAIDQPLPDWPVIIFLGGVHLFALSALLPGTFSWPAVAVALVLHWLTAGVGVTLGYHRLITHRSFRAPKWLEYVLLFCGTLACQSPLEPISTGLLFERVVNLTRNRKRFVVTSDYIGPNRRAKPGPGTQQIPEIEVPNPLKAKATGATIPTSLQRDIDRVAEVLNQQKMERHASGGRDIVSGQEAG